MKNFVRLTVLLAITLVGGHAALWMTGMNKLEEVVNTALKSGEVDTTYSLKRSGYPLALTLTIEDLTSKAIDIDELGTTAVLSNGEVQISSQIGKLEKVHIIAQNVAIDISDKNKQNYTVTLEQLESTASLITRSAEEIHVQNITLAQSINNEAMAIASIGSISARESYEQVKPNVFNRKLDVDINNIHVQKKDEGKELHIKNFTTQARSLNWPDDRELKEIANATQQELEETGQASTHQLKNTLAQFIQSLEEHNSSIHIDRIEMSGDNIDLNINGEFKVIEGAYLTGHLNLDMEGIKSLQDAATSAGTEINPMVKSMIPEEGAFHAKIKMENGMISLNETPIFPIPSLHMLLNFIPEQVNKEKAV